MPTLLPLRSLLTGIGTCGVVLTVCAACAHTPLAAAERETTQPDAAAGRALELLAQPLATAWKHFSEEPASRLGDVWQLQDGVLRCRGTPKGYLWLDRELKDFVLRLEWRWPPGKKPGNGGVLARITGPDKIWPRSLEAQLNSGQAGDFWGLDGFALDGPAERKRSLDHPQFGKLTNLKRARDLEKPAGQWNEMEIVAEGPTVALRVNGREVNRATGCADVAGKLCLTAEGDEIHFRNIRLTPRDRSAGGGR